MLRDFVKTLPVELREEFLSLVTVALYTRMARTELAASKAGGKTDPKLEDVYYSWREVFSRRIAGFKQQCRGRGLEPPKMKLDEICNVFV